MAESPRKKAVLILTDIDKKSAYPNIEMNKLRAAGQYSPIDLRFIGEIINGVIKRKLTLDYIISKHSKLKLNKIAPFVLNVLRSGIYQIVYMDRVPDSAAVNESVKIIKKSSVSRLSAYVNAVLRAVSIEDINSLSSDSAEDLSIKHSFPLWIVKRWICEFGKEFAVSLMEALNQNPSVFVRRCKGILADDLKDKLTADGIESELVSIDDFSEFDYSLRLNKIGNLDKSKAFLDADFYIQSPAAALAAYILEPQPGDIVIDMCAAPGGKTLFMAELMNNKGKIYSFDIYEHKIKLIEENCQKYKADIVTPCINDASVYNKQFFECADKILCDVPCSGFGIISKKPDIKYKRQEVDILSLSKLGKSILDNASKYLKPGGTMVFSTCTIERDENEAVVCSFLEEHPEFALYPYGENKISYKTFYPNVDGTDGFFVCRFKKME